MVNFNYNKIKFIILFYIGGIVFKKYSLFILLIIRTFNISVANNWEIVSTSATFCIHDVFFINENIGWFVSGFDTEVFKTKDNGSSWNMIYSSVSESRQCIQFLNEDKGYTGGFEYPPKNKKFTNIFNTFSEFLND